MIVYNVQRRWFSMKADAERYRVDHGLPKSATAKLQIDDRNQLATLLTVLCNASYGPLAVRQACQDAQEVAVKIPDDTDIPAFLRKSWDELDALARRVRVQETAS